VAPFTAKTLDKNFLPKKFKADKDYRAAVIEATRLAQQAGDVFEPSYLELLHSCQHVSSHTALHSITTHTHSHMT